MIFEETDTISKDWYNIIFAISNIVVIKKMKTFNLQSWENIW